MNKMASTKRLIPFIMRKKEQTDIRKQFLKVFSVCAAPNVDQKEINAGDLMLTIKSELIRRYVVLNRRKIQKYKRQ